MKWLFGFVGLAVIVLVIAAALAPSGDDDDPVGSTGLPTARSSSPATVDELATQTCAKAQTASSLDNLMRDAGTVVRSRGWDNLDLTRAMQAKCPAVILAFIAQPSPTARR